MQRILIALSVASALSANKDEHPHLSLDDILKKYDIHPHADEHLAEADPTPSLQQMHNSVMDVHEKAADLLGSSMPTLAPVMHPDSPLTHHDRLSAILKGMDHDDDKPTAAADDFLSMAAAPEDDSVAAPPADADADAPPADSVAADADAPPADAAPAEGAEADAPKDAPADADAPTEKEVSPEKAAKMASMEQSLLGKMGKSLKMMVMLHMLVKPIEAKLTDAMGRMPPDAKANAKEVMGHMVALDKLTGGALELMNGVKKAKDGTAQEKKTAMLKMIVGLAAIEKGVKSNLLAMKMQGPPGAGGSGARTKLHALMSKMQAKVDAELADPARKDDPLVQIDVQMLAKMKAAVKKSEQLLVVGAAAMKKAATNEDREKVKTSIKGAMQKVMAHMKQDIDGLKDQALVLAKEEAAKAEAAKAEAPEAPEEGKDGELTGLLGKIDGIAAESLLQKGAKKDAPHLRAH